MPMPEMDWKVARDEMVKQLRSQLTKDTPPELMTLMAKFEVKLKGIPDEKAFGEFNALCEKTLAEVSAKYDTVIRIEMLTRLTA